MVSENFVHETISQLQGSGKTFAEFLAVLFKDKYIEVYVGDAYEDVSTEQVSTTYPAVFVGKVVAAYRECLIIDCAFVSKSHHLQMGNLMFVNERAIRALSEVDGKGIIEDMMLRSKESLDIHAAFVARNQNEKK
jgi:hypothetical protein